jgi:zinc transporter ZupT
MTRSDGVAALLMGFAAGVVVCVVIAALIPRVKSSDLIAAHQQGQRDALKTNPASDALERVCAGLWMSRQ